MDEEQKSKNDAHDRLMVWLAFVAAVVVVAIVVTSRVH
jgi:hypothetical protein